MDVMDLSKIDEIPLTIAIVRQVAQESIRRKLNISTHPRAAGEDTAGPGCLARAGIAYALSYAAEAHHGTGIGEALHDGCLLTWPFEAQQFRHGMSEREKLVLAAALLIAEIEQIDPADRSTHS